MRKSTGRASRGAADPSRGGGGLVFALLCDAPGSGVEASVKKRERPQGQHDEREQCGFGGIAEARKGGEDGGEQHSAYGVEVGARRRQRGHLVSPKRLRKSGPYADERKADSRGKAPSCFDSRVGQKNSQDRKRSRRKKRERANLRRGGLSRGDAQNKAGGCSGKEEPKPLIHVDGEQTRHGQREHKGDPSPAQTEPEKIPVERVSGKKRSRFRQGAHKSPSP